MNIKSILLAASLMAAASVSNAAIINASSELQSVVDSLSDVAGIVDIQNDQVSGDEVWSTFQPSASSSTFIASFWGGNTSPFDLSDSTAIFGIYDVKDYSKTVQLSFSSLNDIVTFSIRASDGLVIINNFIDTGVNFSGNQFGFYSTNTYQGVTYTGYSEMSRNANSEDAMVTYRNTAGFLNAGQSLIAFDPNLSGDFDDLAVVIESAAPVSAPGALALLGLGLVGLGLGRRKA